MTCVLLDTAFPVFYQLLSMFCFLSGDFSVYILLACYSKRSLCPCSACLCMCLFICLSISVSVCLSVYVSVILKQSSLFFFPKKKTLPAEPCHLLFLILQSIVSDSFIPFKGPVILLHMNQDSHTVRAGRLFFPFLCFWHLC